MYPGIECLSIYRIAQVIIADVMTSVFSLPQCVGYVALVLGVASFLQKTDRRLKIVLIFQCIAYAIHFVLLGNIPASASNCVSIVRTILSLKTKSLYVAFFLTIVVIAIGFATIKSPAGLLPIVASIVAIYGMFLLEGVPFRLSMLVCTAMWLTNNIISHSIGGVILETLIATTNTYTIVRMNADARALAALEA